MAGKPWRLKPALYTTTLVYIAVQVAFLSFLCSYYNYGIGNLTRWTLDRLDETVEAEVNLGDEMQVLNAEQLALFDGSRASRPVYLAILGRVYNVDKGKKHYGKGGGYHFFAGRDATRAFVSGDFTEAGLVDNTDGLSHEDLLGIRDWVSFYEKDYKLVGVLVGRYYDANGIPTKELKDVLARMKTAAEWKQSRAAEAEVFPPCNSEWHQNSGGRVWCSMKSGGIQRDWAGVPRLLYDPNTKQQRCACVKNFGTGLSSYGSKSNNRGDLDHPNLKLLANGYSGVKPIISTRSVHRQPTAAALRRTRKTSPKLTSFIVFFTKETMVQDTKVEDMRLPPAVVSKIVDKAIGPNGTVSKEARTAIGRAASIFIHQMSSHACEFATNKKRKALTPEDIFQAFHLIECDHLTAPLQEALEQWKANKAHKSEETRKRKAEKKDAEKSAAETSEKHLSSSFTIAPSEEMRFREEPEEQS
ncbi:cytochrome b5-like Heme/Steroid binding domain protein [Ancylostoma caninum]|uniref:Cytochrome b5-like Heme/Steroid binding domain protein n=1 Tax=Ancylostoma caninum TaxID=29170 RepID=A0A368H4I8_ANCCA|nr:cytochrome b5-like Heme/Steroid binding domain protein [Ancylostoma caninum]